MLVATHELPAGVLIAAEDCVKGGKSDITADEVANADAVGVIETMPLVLALWLGLALALALGSGMDKLQTPPSCRFWLPEQEPDCPGRASQRSEPIKVPCIQHW